MSDIAPAPFGAELLRFRTAAGLTQEQLAARAGLSPNTIAALEHGRRRAPRGATVELLAGALGLDRDARAQFGAAARGTAVPARVGTREERDGEWAAAPRGSLAALAASPPTPLVDRADDLALILHLLTVEGARLVTLTGPAGVGKTRLALAAAARLAGGADRFPDGVTLVDLTPIREPDLVLGAIARGLGLLDIGGRPLLERLVEVLAGRQQLVVLDNVEQVLPAAAQLADLLATCPGLALLVTSRVPLQLRWERTLRIAPLPIPDLSAALPSLEALQAVPSVELFVGRARAHRATFALEEKQTPLVARLVARLDGLPLALELAAARLDVLPLPALARHLEGRLQLLASRAPDRPERQRSLEAAVGWSYDLLSEPERRLFRCLGVFVGRVALDAIAAVAGAEPGSAGGAGGAGDERRALDRLVALAEQSLVLPLLALPDEAGEEDDDDPEPAFGMLETMREYAEERLAAAGELEAARHAHAHYFLALAERAAPELRGRDQRAWYFRLEREHDNLRAALGWLLDQNGLGEREAGLRLAGALGYFWWQRGYWTEGRRWLSQALDRRAMAGEGEGDGEGGADLAVRSRALLAAGPLLTLQAEFARARVVLEEARALAERRRDPAGIARALTYLGFRALIAGEVAEGARLLHEARHRWEALGDPHGLGIALFYLGRAADTTGDYAAAAPYYADALRRLEAAGDAQTAGHVHCFLGVVEWRRGEVPDAVEHIRAAVRTSISPQDRVLLGVAAQAAVALTRGGADAAGRARLLGALDALVRATGAPAAWERMPGGEDVAGLRERLAREGQGELTAAFREGQSLHSGAMAAFALDLLEEAARTLAEPQGEGTQAPQAAQSAQRSAGQPASPLSAREAEVLRLVAEGLSSKEIGRRLFVAPSTVNYHLTSIFNKLGVDTRAQAVAVTAQRGLL